MRIYFKEVNMKPIGCITSIVFSGDYLIAVTEDGKQYKVVTSTIALIN